MPEFRQPDRAPRGVLRRITASASAAIQHMTCDVYMYSDTCVKNKGGTVSSNSRFQTVLFQRYSANLSPMAARTT